MKEKDRHPPLDYQEITEGIYIGTNACCQAHFDERLLTEAGITADISLEAEQLDSPQGVDYYLWLPVKDHTPPTVKQLDVGVTALEALVRNRVRVYVHCKNGHGRAPTLVAAYLMKQGKSFLEAEAILKGARASVHMELAQKERLSEWISR